MRIIQPAAVALALALALSPAACGLAAENEVVKVDFYVTVPKDTDPQSTIYLAGNLPELGEWRADGVALKRLNGDGVYHAALKLPRGRTLEYKVTRGSWDTVEKGPTGEELSNRRLTLGADAVEKIEVATWRNHAAAPQPAAVKSTITGDVRTHDLESKILHNRRKVLVWLPPDYEKNPDARYPVLYMQDGQNVFDDATSFAGEWHADEIADKLIREGKIPPIIIVAIESNWQRLLEYTPGNRSAPGKADMYVKFVVEEVKPLIDKTYRTKPNQANTGIAGSSLGALVSLYAAREYPEVFGRCGALSASLWWGDGQFIEDARKDLSWAKHTRIWLDIGTGENEDPEKAREVVERCEQFAQLLNDSGLKPDQDYTWRAVEGADHNEQAWAQRFDQVLVFLFGNQ